MATNSYDIGDVVQLSASFANADGDPLAPAGNVRFLHRDASGTVTVYTTSNGVVAASSYLFTVDITIASSGKNYYRVESSTGVGQAAEESWFNVYTQHVST